jgi:thiamine phosphate synthase YjbQ (UPF0047 family)
MESAESKPSRTIDTSELKDALLRRHYKFKDGIENGITEYQNAVKEHNDAVRDYKDVVTKYKDTLKTSASSTTHYPNEPYSFTLLRFNVLILSLLVLILALLNLRQSYKYFSSKSQLSPSPPSYTDPAMPSSSWFQKTLTLPARSRGSYLITDSITSQLPEIQEYRVGLLHLFMQHTSAALSLNENWDDDVRADMSDALDRIVPEDKGRKGLYRHSAEGSDDMPVSFFVFYCVC